MKKFLFSLFACVCVLMAVALVLPAMPVSAQTQKSALVGASLYIDDQVDIVFCFDPDVIAAKKAEGKSFSFTFSYNNKTYTESDLVAQKDTVSGKVYKTITVGPFKATERNTVFTYSGSMNEAGAFSLVSLAKSGINYYASLSNTTDNQRVVKMLKSFVNYAVAIDNKANSKSEKLPYEVSYTNPGFTADPGNGTAALLNPSKVLTGRNFILSDDVYVRYTGSLSSTSESISGWKITVNTVDVTSSANLTKSGSTFSFTVPVHADQGQEKLRIIIRDGSGNVICDCIDRADALAIQTGTDFAEYKELSGALTQYLQAVSDYNNNPAIDANRTFEEGKFYAGFGRVDITPYCDSTELNTSGTLSTEFLDPIYATCVAMRDAKGTVSLVFSLDVRNIQDKSVSGIGVPYDKMRASAKAAASAAGFTLGDDQIFFVATHNHSAPSVTSTDSTVVTWYKNLLFPSIEKAAKFAIQDLAIVENTYTGTAITGDGTNYNRRYIHEKSWYGSWHVTGYEDGRDREMRTVRFDREGAKDILLVNWQGHAANAASKADKGTADFVGALRTKVEKDLDVHFLYINGASGDLNMTNQSDLWNDKSIEPDTTHFRTSSGIDYVGVGNSVATTVKNLVGSSQEKKVSLGDIKTSAVTTNSVKNGSSTSLTNSEGKLYLKYRKHSNGSYCLVPNTYSSSTGTVVNCDQCHGMYLAMTASGAAYNKTTSAEWNGTTYTYKANTYNTAKQFAYAKDQFSPYQFQNIAIEFDLWTMTIGDNIGFAFAPYEMFNQNGVALRNAVGSDKHIISASYANGYNSYVASEVAFNKVEADQGGANGDDGSSEVYATKYLKGCAEYFQTLLSNSLKNQFGK